MEYLYAVLLLMGGLGAFLMGASIVSENIGKLANGGIKKLFNRTSKNKLVGVGIGAASTAIVQSSGLTTIMVVGLVNAEIMTLFQATTVIMGANIGTTITAQIAALQAFDFDKFAIGLTCVGALMVMLCKKERANTSSCLLFLYCSFIYGVTLLMSRGNIVASRTFFAPSKCMVSLSKPIPKPPWGGAPYLCSIR
jgi:phosphate:Na+ symporter